MLILEFHYKKGGAGAERHALPCNSNRKLLSRTAIKSRDKRRLTGWKPVLFLLCRPALGHQSQQVLHGFLVGATLLFGQLAGAFIELSGHFAAFFRRATSAFQGLREQFKIHNLKG